MQNLDNILFTYSKNCWATFTSILDSYYDISETCPERIWHGLLSNFVDPSKYRLIRDHFGYTMNLMLSNE
jgi:hypothetical protein